VGFGGVLLDIADELGFVPVADLDAAGAVDCFGDHAPSFVR
jgi:hypothetical protein